MRKILIILSGCLILNINSLGQTKSRISMDISLHGINTIYDKVDKVYHKEHYKQKGLGLDLSFSIGTNSKFSPQVDVIADFIMSTVPGIALIIDGKSTHKYSAYNIFIGSSYQVVKHFKLSFTIGTSFINSYTYLGMKPELCYSIGNKERVKIMFSLTHIRPKYGGKVYPFGYLGLGVGYRLF